MRHTARLIVLGRQGAGKGTQCQRLAARLGVPHVSTGELLRAEVAAGTAVGRQASTFMASGSLVPDELVLDLVACRLGSSSARAAGYLLDGFPRTLAQAQALFEVLGGGAADLAVELHVPTAVVLPRLAARRVCPSCGNTGSVGPGDVEPLPCDDCGDRMVRRDDDTEEAIRQRLDLYDTESGPLLVWLDSQGLLVTVDGVGHTDAVHQRLLERIGRRVPGVPSTTAAGGSDPLADCG